MLRKIANTTLFVFLSFGLVFALPTAFVSAAAQTAFTDTMSTQAKNVAADHTLTWTLASGHTTAVNAVITVDFVQADFVTSGTWQTTDFTFSDNVRSAAAPSAVGTGAATCSGSSASNYIGNVTAATSTFAITTCTGWTTSAATTPTTFVIKGATGGTGALTNANADTNSSLITLTDSGNDTDATSGAAVIETNAVVTVTATVNPSLTFAVSASTVALGTLSTSAITTGNHTLSAGTNASGGFIISYNGATLTSSNAIDDINAIGATKTASAPGTEQFGVNIGTAPTTNAGTCTAATNYNTTGSYAFVASTTTPVTSETAPADCVFTAIYGANISTVTPSGSYSTTVNWIASGAF